MLFFWYCFDDWAARVSGEPWVGSIPWIVILLLHIPLGFGAISVRIRK